nr:protein O-linked-mannose beta-1,2-N-acetylglucosaminyltransferase 1-like [Procambarus clarkii]
MGLHPGGGHLFNLGAPGGNLGAPGGNLGAPGDNLGAPGGNLGAPGGNLGAPGGNLQAAECDLLTFVQTHQGRHSARETMCTRLLGTPYTCVARTVTETRKKLVLIMVAVTWQLCSCLVPAAQHQPRLLSVDAVSSARGAALSYSCLTQQCHQEWNSTITASSGKTNWWSLGVHDGVIMTVLHDTTGSILLRKTFNTWNAYAFAHDLTWWMEKVQAGRVVVLVVRRAGTYGLGAALLTLTRLGSLLAPFAPPLALWVWAFVVGGQTLLETVMPNPHPLDKSLAALHAHALISLPYRKTQFLNKQIHSSQLHFCDSNAAMGPLCDPFRPMVMPIVPSTADKISSMHDEATVGVVVCAGGRLQYLVHSLIRLLEARNVSPYKVLVALGTDHNGILDSNIQSLLDLSNLNYQIINIQPNVSSINHRLFQFYREAWKAGVKAFPNARYLAFLDEDVEISHDWMQLLLHYAPALEVDDSLWCVSGISAAHINMHSDPHMIMRGSRQPGWGFLVLREEARAAVAIWPNTSSQSILYDTFLYITVGRDRECIYPVLSRSRHYGIGVNTLPDLHHFYFLERPLHNGSSVLLPPVSALTRETYEVRIWSRLSRASVITRNPCAPGFLRSPQINESMDFVFYFFLDNPKNSLEWALLAECVGAWPYSTQGMHKGSVELPQPWGGSLWLVGVPASPYKFFKPSYIPIWRISTEDAFVKQATFVSSLRSMKNLNNRTLTDAVKQLSLQKHHHHFTSIS